MLHAAGCCTMERLLSGEERRERRAHGTTTTTTTKTGCCSEIWGLWVCVLAMARASHDVREGGDRHAQTCGATGTKREGLIVCVDVDDGDGRPTAELRAAVGNILRDLPKSDAPS